MSIPNEKYIERNYCSLDIQYRLLAITEFAPNCSVLFFNVAERRTCVWFQEYESAANDDVTRLTQKVELLTSKCH